MFSTADVQAAMRDRAGVQSGPGTQVAFPAQQAPRAGTDPALPAQRAPTGAVPQAATPSSGAATAPFSPAFGNMATYPSLPAQDASRPGAGPAFASQPGVTPGHAGANPAFVAQPPGTNPAFPAQPGPGPAVAAQGWTGAPAGPHPQPAPAPHPHAPPRAASSPSHLSGPITGAPGGSRPPMAPLRQSGVRSAARAGVGDFEAEMIARGRRRVIVAVGTVVVALLTVAGVVVGPELLERRHDPAAAAKVLAALDVIKRGDSAGANEAVKLADEALAIDPGYRGAKATRGMALHLVAADLRDRIDRLERQRPGLDRAFKKAEEAGDKAAQDQVRDQMGQLATQHAELVNEITRVKGEAEPLVNDAYKGAENDPDAIRAMGLMRALEGDETNVAKLVKAYRHEVEIADGWAELIAGLAGAAGKGSPEKRNAAIAALEQALAQDPAMTIAHVGIGRSRLDLGDHAGARAALEKALAATPGNAFVKRLLADVQMSETEAAERAKKKAEAQAPPPPAQPSVSDANPANSEPDSLGTGNPPATRR